VCDFFGPTDFLQMDANRLSDGQIHDAPDSPESKLVGGPIQDNPDKVLNPAAQSAIRLSAHELMFCLEMRGNWRGN
jgi:hypothetical protein